MPALSVKSNHIKFLFFLERYSATSLNLILLEINFLKNPNKLTKTQKNQIIQRIKDESIDREILARDNSFTRFDLLVGPDSKTRAPKRNLLQLTSGIDNDIDIEIRRLENLADMGDYDAYEALDELYKYRDGFSGNIALKTAEGVAELIFTF